jgi:hypothetical protein
MKQNNATHPELKDISSKPSNRDEVLHDEQKIRRLNVYYGLTGLWTWRAEFCTL